MTLKGEVRPDHIPVNQFSLTVPGLPRIWFTNIAGIDVETETTDLPDKTTASGGNTTPIEFTARQPGHHSDEVLAMEAWRRSAEHPQASDYRKNCILAAWSGTGAITREWQVVRGFPRRLSTPELDRANAGDMLELTWTIRADDMFLIR